MKLDTILDCNKESLARQLIYVGSRTDKRDTFFCVAKRKYPKKRRPTTAASLRSSLLAGAGKRDSCPFASARHPSRAPNGLFQLKVPVLGAVNGNALLTNNLAKGNFLGLSNIRYPFNRTYTNVTTTIRIKRNDAKHKG